MEINPYEARMRILEAQDGVQMQREAAPDDELAGCPGCPYFWTCPVPHRGETVSAAPEIEVEDVADQIGSRSEYRPRDVQDIGWTDEWVDVDEDDAGRTDEGSAAGEHPANRPGGPAAADQDALGTAGDAAPARRSLIRWLIRRG